MPQAAGPGKNGGLQGRSRLYLAARVLPPATDCVTHRVEHHVILHTLVTESAQWQACYESMRGSPANGGMSGTHPGKVVERVTVMPFTVPEVATRHSG